MNRFQSWYGMQPVALRALLTINVVIYVLWSVVFVHIDSASSFILTHFALNPGWPNILFEPWQLVTYSFLHLGTGLNGLLHILFNMLWLVWIGREHEELHGPHRLLALYIIGALGGSLLTVLLHNLFPGSRFFDGYVHGASGSVLAVMMAVGTMYPYKSIGLLFIGAVRLIYVVLGFLALDILFLASGGTSVSAHMGGALIGFLYARAEMRGIDLSGWARVFFPSRQARPRTASARSAPDSSVFGRMDSWLAQKNAPKEDRARTATIHQLRKSLPKTGDEPTSPPLEIDRILDKISEKGMEALTDEERRTLEEASRK